MIYFYPWTLEWWKYMFAYKSRWVSWPTVLWCRLRGHPYPYIWYSQKLEPDMTCENCGDDLR